MGPAVASPVHTAQPGRSVSGPVLFARYAYPPNRLGLCGPSDAPALIHGAAAEADRELRNLALGFEGAYPYLRLIADQNGLADPLDHRVVEAYWLGNDLTARVQSRQMHREVGDRFRSRMAPKDWRWLEAAVAGGTRPTHAVHVFEIFPRVGLLRGGSAPMLETIDACRIRWGTILSASGDKLVVSAPRLELHRGTLRIGAPLVETVTGWRDASGPIGGARPGDIVSLHWGWACSRLSPEQYVNLVGWTKAAIRSANRAF
jgi:hypothetical protein